MNSNTTTKLAKGEGDTEGDNWRKKSYSAVQSKFLLETQRFER